MSATTHTDQELLPEEEQLDLVVRLLFGNEATSWQPLESIIARLEEQTSYNAPCLGPVRPLLQRLIEEGALLERGRGNVAMVRLHINAAGYVVSEAGKRIRNEIRVRAHDGSVWDRVSAALPRPVYRVSKLWEGFARVLLALSPLMTLLAATVPITAPALRDTLPAGEYPAWLVQGFPEPRLLPEFIATADELAMKILLFVWLLCAVWFFLYRRLVPEDEKPYCAECHTPFWQHAKFPAVGLVVWAVAPLGIWAAFGVFLIGGFLTVAAMEARLSP